MERYQKLFIECYSKYNIVLACGNLKAKTKTKQKQIWKISNITNPKGSDIWCVLRVQMYYPAVRKNVFSLGQIVSLSTLGLSLLCTPTTFLFSINTYVLRLFVHERYRSLKL